MRITNLLLTGLALSLITLMSASAQTGGDGDGEGSGDCRLPRAVGFATTDMISVGGVATPGTRSYTCPTYFFGIHIMDSTVNCPDWKRTIPDHYHCTTITSTISDCVNGTGNKVITNQPMKVECEGQTGLNIEFGGVEIGIDWWKAVCKKDGAVNNGIHVADSAIGCY